MTLRRSACAALLGALLSLAACRESTILEQETPSRVPVGTLDSPLNAGLLVASAAGDFECALALYVVATGLVGDELVDAQLAAASWDYDRRTIFPGARPYAVNGCDDVTSVQTAALYAPLSIARFQADDALRRLDEWTDEEVANRDSLIAVAAAYAGYSLTLLGEVMCSAAIDVGPELTPEQLLTEAEARFTRTIETTAAVDPAIIDMARVGRARARLGLGRYAEARADAALVAEGFARLATYAAGVQRRENRVHTYLYRDNYGSVDPSFRGLTFAGVPDPRVVVVDAGRPGQDRVTPVWQATKYATINAPIPIATYEEAQLIVAEADARAGDLGSAVAIINALHARVGLPRFDSSDPQAVLAQLIDERRRELFLEGHRLGDIIRYGVVLTPPEGAPYPVKGGEYGEDQADGQKVCFPLPDVERNNNPNIPDA